MKKLLLFAVAFTLLYAVSSAQYCGGSGPSVCTASGTLTDPGFTPSEDIPCIVRGANTDIVLEFKNFNQATISFGPITITSLRFDSIENLPLGLCWASNTANNTFGNQEDGCIHITGTTNAPQGQYKLRIKTFVNGALSIDMQTTGINCYLRVVNYPSSFCPPVDTNNMLEYDSLAGFYDSVSLISGKAYYDLNNNNSIDSTDIVASNILVSTNGFSSLTNYAGNYKLYVPSNVYTVAPIVNSSEGIYSTPDSLLVSSVAWHVTYAGNDFAIHLPPNYCNSEISLVPQWPPARPGFNSSIQVKYKNILSQVALSPLLELTYDSLQSFVSSDVVPTTVDSINHVLTWQLNNIYSGTQWVANVIFHTPATVPIHSVLNYSLQSLNSTCTNLDSVFNYQTTVVGSYDPNDKSVSPVGYTVNQGINPNLTNELTYLVRFQNTGTFMAENITVIDTLSNNVDVSSLKVLSASADYEVQINGHTVKFVFKNINLPDSTSNEPMSHGYVQYSVKPIASLPQDAVIDNLADIYFDFNAPIRTNTATSTIDYTVVSGITEVAKAQYTFALRPNPTTGALQITIDKELLGKQLTLTDISGRVLLSKKVDAITDNINLSNYANGIYFVKVDAAVKRLVKQ